MLGHKLQVWWGTTNTYIEEMREAYSKWWARLMSIIGSPMFRFTPRQTG